MKKLSLFSFLILLTTVFLMTSCGDPVTSKMPPVIEVEKFTQSDRANIRTAIMQANKNLINTWKQENSTDAWLAMHASGSHESKAGNGHTLILNNVHYNTVNDIKATFTKILADRTTDVTMKNESVYVVSADCAIHTGDFSFNFTRGGTKSSDFTASATTVWVKEGAAWKILHYHQSAPQST